MLHFLHHFFSTNGFMPHGHCYLWQPDLIALNVISDGLIALAYYSIPVTLIYFVHRRKDLVFDSMFLCFAVFIMACGGTHILDIINIWYPIYWVSAAVKMVTAIASIITAILLVRLIPQALALPSPSQLNRANEDLQQEIDERKQFSDKVEKLNIELREQATKLEAANKELEAFSYSVSHDLRAPLRHIQSFSEILQEEASPNLDESGRHYLSRIARSTQRMSLLIDDLLAFSRTGIATMAQDVIETKKLVDEVIQELTEETTGRNIAWNIGILPKVEGDRALLKQVWINLLSNAVKYTRDRIPATIAITCKEEKGFFEFCVQDNGVGFDMQYASKLFGIFERLHPEQFEGTGVGLANVRRIITRHGGKTWAEGKPNEGAAFYFTLPMPIEAA